MSARELAPSPARALACSCARANVVPRMGVVIPRALAREAGLGRLPLPESREAELNSIDIAGPADALRGLLLIPGLDLLIHSSQQIDDATYTISAFATDEAITALQARPGVTVTVIADNAVVAAHRVQVQADIAAAAEGPPVG